MQTNQLVGWFDAGFSEKLKLVPLPSPIPKLQHAPLPFLVLRAGSVPSSPHNSTVLKTKAHLGFNLGLGSVSHMFLKVLLGALFTWTLWVVLLELPNWKMTSTFVNVSVVDL